jgi:hypothetical protein
MSKDQPRGKGWFLGFLPIVSLLFLAQAAGILFLLGCGVQGPPQPPRVEVPERVTDLSVFQVGRRLEIRFTLPQRAMDGQRLTKPLEIEILHAFIPLGPPPGSPPLALWTSLQPGEWAHYASDQRIIFPAPLSREEFENWLARDSVITIRTLTRGFRHRPLASENSNLAKIRLLDVSGPVDHFTSQTTEKAIELAWRPPANTLDGRQLEYFAGYRIYRSATGKPGSFEVVGESQEPRYDDSNFEFGRAYSYEVRALFKRDGTQAESEGSQPYEVIPRDIFPPARPLGLTALYTAGAVDLVWTANSEKDLAGYYVYRHEKGEQPMRLNKELLRTPILRDAGVHPGHTYFYWVTAVDLSNNESQPSEEVSVEAGD